MKIGRIILGDLVVEVNPISTSNSEDRYTIRVWHQCSESGEGAIWYEECDEKGKEVRYAHGGLCATDNCGYTLSLKNINALKMMHLLHHAPLGSCNADLRV